MNQPYEQILSEVKAAIAALDRADALTLWQEVEPAYWLRISAARRDLIQAELSLRDMVAAREALEGVKAK